MEDNNILHFKSKPPFSFFVSIFITIGIGTLLIVNGMPWTSLPIYVAIVSIILFSSVAKYSCTVLIYANRIEIKYLMLWHKNEILKFDSKPIINIRWNYWSFKLDDDYERYRSHVFYNTLTINNTVFKINTRIGDTKKIIKELEKISSYRL